VEIVVPLTECPYLGHVDDVLFKVHIFSTWSNFVHFAFWSWPCSWSRVWQLQTPFYSFDKTELGRHAAVVRYPAVRLFTRPPIHLSTREGPCVPLVPADRQFVCVNIFFALCLFLQLFIIRPEIYFILSESSRHLAFLKWILILYSFFRRHLQFQFVFTSFCWNFPTLCTFQAVLYPVVLLPLSVAGHSIWRYIYSPFFWAALFIRFALLL